MRFLMNTISLLRLVGLTGVLLFSVSSSPAYVNGYIKFYGAATKTIIDVIFDSHEDSPTHTYDEISSLEYADIKNALWATEKTTLEAFEYLNDYSPHPIDLVWESSPTDPSRRPMLISADWIVKNRFSRIHFKHADTWRDDFAHLFLRRRKLRYGVSLENPVPVGSKTYQLIKNQVGPSVTQAFNELRERVKCEARDYYKPHFTRKRRGYNFWDTHIRNNDIYDAIADIEMLSHILSSNKRRIILYAGNWHCANISDFLEANGFTVIYEVVDTSESELYTHELSPLMELHSELAQQATAAA